MSVAREGATCQGDRSVRVGPFWRFWLWTRAVRGFDPDAFMAKLAGTFTRLDTGFSRGPTE
jgi:hypothetical protein